MANWELDINATVGLAVLIVAIVASVLWERLRRRCGNCGRWNALVKTDTREYLNHNPDSRFRCKFCGFRCWKEDAPKHHTVDHEQYPS